MAGEQTVTITRSMRFGSNTIGGVEATVTTGDFLPVFQETFPAIVVAKEIDIAIDKDVMKCIIIVADKACTLWTNSSGTPVDTFALTAGKPAVFWVSTDTAANPFSVDVTKFFLTTTVINTQLKIGYALDVSV